jgi:hypothetical protein
MSENENVETRKISKIEKKYENMKLVNEINKERAALRIQWYSVY